MFDEISREAEKLGLRVTGSELVGLIPLEAVLMAGNYYLKKQGRSPGVPENELIHTAITSLGLDDLGPFDPKKKIIEFQFGDRRGPLASMTLGDFCDELSIDSPAPGGGSVAALAGALSASLVSMVSNLTAHKKGFEDVGTELKECAEEAQAAKDALLIAIDDDTRAFNEVMAAFGLPKKTDEQKAERQNAIQLATQKATEVPLKVMELALNAMKLARIVADKGMESAASDAGVSALMGRAAIEGAGLNVKINLSSIDDKNFADNAKKKMQTFRDKGQRLEKEILDVIEKKI